MIKSQSVFVKYSNIRVWCISLLASMAFTAAPAKTISGFQADSEQADIIFWNGVIYTAEPGQSLQQAIAIKGDRILAVGPNKSVFKFQGSATRVEDLKGGFVMPGFVDSHTHLFNDFRPETPNLKAAQNAAIENGITTLGNLFALPETVLALINFEPYLKIRTSLYLQKTDNCGNISDDWYLDYAPTRNFGERLRIGGVKLFTDGGTCGGPAVSVERRPGTGLGNLFHNQDTLNAMVIRAHDAGYQVAIHAIGDRGIEQALNAIDAANAGEPNIRKHRIEHVGIITKNIIKRFGEVGAVATVFGYKRTCWIPESLPLFYQNSENAHRSLMTIEPGVVVAWHGDDPWVEPLNPLIDLFSLVTRIDVISDEAPCEPPDWLANQALSVENALQLMTLNAAYALDRDQEVGSLKAQKLADLILLSANPFAVDSDDLKDIRVLSTMIGGEVLYSVPSGAFANSAAIR